MVNVSGFLISIIGVSLMEVPSKVLETQVKNIILQSIAMFNPQCLKGTNIASFSNHVNNANVQAFPQPPYPKANIGHTSIKGTPFHHKKKCLPSTYKCNLCASRLKILCVIRSVQMTKRDRVVILAPLL